MADKLIDNHLGIVNCGNWYRIKKVMRKAKSGEPITVLHRAACPQHRRPVMHIWYMSGGRNNFLTRMSLM